MFWIKKEKGNALVTDYYLETIGEALKGNDRVSYSYNLDEIHPQKGDIVVVSTATNALKMYLRGINYYFWAQGVWPEESNMRHHSKIRFIVCSFIEKLALKKAKFVFMVSDTMKLFYEKKYKIDFSDRYFIMPCSNDKMNDKNFLSRPKYNQNIFCYAGATSIWQCFEETIELYSKIEKNIPNAKLLLLVKDRELALKYIKKYKVKNFEIDFVSIDELNKKLSNVKFGFILRKESPVNYVATPTKLLTYLSNGIIPIYSESLAGIKEILKNTKYKIEYHNDGNIKDIEILSREKIEEKNILKEYGDIYAERYDREQSIEKIRKSIKQ